MLFVDYLTLLPPPGAAPPLSDVDVALGRRVADTLERLTGEAAAETGCGWVRAAQASREHHAWSADPPGRPIRFAVAGDRRVTNARMRAVAELVALQASGHPAKGGR